MKRRRDDVKVATNWEVYNPKYREVLADREKNAGLKPRRIRRIAPSPILARTLVNSPSFDPAENNMLSINGAQAAMDKTYEQELHLPQLTSRQAAASASKKSSFN